MSRFRAPESNLQFFAPDLIQLPDRLFQEAETTLCCCPGRYAAPWSFDHRQIYECLKLIPALLPTMMLGTEEISVNNPPIFVNRPSQRRNPKSISRFLSFSSTLYKQCLSYTLKRQVSLDCIF